jgi:phosphoglycolate phosphatase
MKFSAVVFDLDGTLLDTLQDIADAANSVLARFGLPIHSVDAYRQFVGQGVRTLFRRALPEERGSDAFIESCAAGFREDYGRHWNVHTRPYPGIEELLTELARRGVRMAVLSNKPDAFTKRCIREYFPAARFELVLGQRDGVPQKPHPAGAREIVDHVGIPAERFVYLGDSGLDMQTARDAGMYPVGVSWGFRSIDQLSRAGARAIIRQPIELLEYFQDD